MKKNVLSFMAFTCIDVTLSKKFKKWRFDCISVANFSLQKVGNNSNAPATIDFTTASLNAATFVWNFGDASISASNDPSHKYLNAGTFTVTLTASAGSKSDTSRRQ